MRIAVWRWLIIFVKRPIRLRDFATLLQLLRKSMRPRSRLAVDHEPAPLQRERPIASPRVAIGRRPLQPVQRPSLIGVAAEGLEVTEHPIHTLPADLQDELTAGASGLKRCPEASAEA